MYQKIFLSYGSNGVIYQKIYHSNNLNWSKLMKKFFFLIVRLKNAFKLRPLLNIYLFIKND